MKVAILHAYVSGACAFAALLMAIDQNWPAAAFNLAASLMNCFCCALWLRKDAA